jgi:hypothetical protein
VKILRRVEIISVRISQTISSSFKIGPEPSGPIPIYVILPELENFPVF